ncbi:MAG: cation transporter [Firmicutes bacterium]|nr:cation transporter [Bacillota bacterium]
MKLIDIVLIVVVVVIIILALKPTRKHMKAQGGCCGNGNVIVEPDKVLTNPVLGSMEFRIEGMTCENCANRIKRALNRMEGVSSQVYLNKKKAIIEYSQEIDVKTILNTIENLGYQAKRRG